MISTTHMHAKHKLERVVRTPELLAFSDAAWQYQPWPLARRRSWPAGVLFGLISE
jgi:hypothetical protein